MEGDATLAAEPGLFHFETWDFASSSATYAPKELSKGGFAGVPQTETTDPLEMKRKPN